MLRLENMTKTYYLKEKRVHAVDDVSLDFHKGELVSILGLSGSGKTTLVSQIGGLDTPTQGRLIVNGIDTTGFKQQDWNNYRKNNIGFVFQDFNLISHLTAKENVEIALSLSGLSTREKSDRADELLELMGLSNQRDQLPKQLSGGQKQRVAIARALSNKPDIILADEPTGALDPDTSVQIMEILQNLASEGHLVIMVTHDKYLAEDYSTRIVELDGGKVIQNNEIRTCKKYEVEQLTTDKSSLQFMTAIKIALNNLRIRKKSTIFSLISLIPSMILTVIIMNFIFNIMGYQEDFRPLLDHVLSEENIVYIAPYKDDEVEPRLNRVYKDLESKRLNSKYIEPFIEDLVAPYDKKEIANMEMIPGVEKVLMNMTFHVFIKSKMFILVALPPKEYADYQAAIDSSHYPKDNEEGIILSSEARDILLRDKSSEGTLIGEDIEMELTHFRGVPVGLPVRYTDKYKLNVPVLDVFESDSKTNLMKNYYRGYIFASEGYVQKLRDRFETKDFTLFFLELLPPDITITPEMEKLLVEGRFLIKGGQSMADALRPLRMKSLLQEQYGLFNIREYSMHMKALNYPIKHTLITNKDFTKDSLRALEDYGTVSSSRFDASSVASMKKTNKIMNYSLLGAIGVAVIVTLIPALLVCLILYISILLRTKEIGILKSIGARNKDILNIFTLESGLLALSCGVISLVFAIPAIGYIYDMLEDKYQFELVLGSNPMSYNVWGIVVAFILSVGIITLIGLLPGKKASTLNPNTLLKERL